MLTEHLVNISTRSDPTQAEALSIKCNVTNSSVYLNRPIQYHNYKVTFKRLRCKCGLDTESKRVLK